MMSGASDNFTNESDEETVLLEDCDEFTLRFKSETTELVRNTYRCVWGGCKSARHMEWYVVPTTQVRLTSSVPTSTIQHASGCISFSTVRMPVVIYHGGFNVAHAHSKRNLGRICVSTSQGNIGGIGDGCVPGYILRNTKHSKQYATDTLTFIGRMLCHGP